MDVTTTYYSVLRKTGKNRKFFGGRISHANPLMSCLYYLAADLNLASEMKVLRFGGGNYIYDLCYKQF